MSSMVKHPMALVLLQLIESDQVGVRDVDDRSKFALEAIERIGRGGLENF